MVKGNFEIGNEPISDEAYISPTGKGHQRMCVFKHWSQPVTGTLRSGSGNIASECVVPVQCSHGKVRADHSLVRLGLELPLRSVNFNDVL